MNPLNPKSPFYPPIPEYPINEEILREIQADLELKALIASLKSLVGPTQGEGGEE